MYCHISNNQSSNDILPDIKSIHLSPNIKGSMDSLIKLANSIKKMVKREHQRYEQMGKKHEIYLLIGVSENNGHMGYFKLENNGKPGRPEKVFYVYDDCDVTEAFVTPHIHILIISDHVHIYASIIMDYLIKKFGAYVYKQDCTQYKETCYNYILNQSKHTRIYADCDFDPHDFSYNHISEDEFKDYYCNYHNSADCPNSATFEYIKQNLEILSFMSTTQKSQTLYNEMSYLFNDIMTLDDDTTKSQEIKARAKEILQIADNLREDICPNYDNSPDEIGLTNNDYTELYRQMDEQAIYIDDIKN